MKSNFIYSVIITWHTSLSLFMGSTNAQTSNCGTNDLWCERLESNHSVCISPSMPNRNNNQGVMLDIRGRFRTYTCHWSANNMNTQYSLHLLAPEGWRILLRVNSTRNIQVKAGDGQYSDDADDSCDNDDRGNEDTDTTFDSVEDFYFYKADHFVSRTNFTWVNVALHPCRSKQKKSNFREEFEVFVGAARIKDAVSVEDNQCNKSQMYNWTSKGYHADGVNANMANGSLSIRCNNHFPPQDVLISFRYQLNISDLLRSYQYNGLIQLVYKDARNIINDEDLYLYLTYGYTKCKSFWIEFNASGKMHLQINNVTVQGLIYDEPEEVPTCPPETSPERQTPPLVQSPSTLSSLVSPPVASSPASFSSTSSTTAEDETSSSPANMATENSTSKNDRQKGQDTPGFLIPTVSVVVVFLLVSIAVLFICCKKRYHKRQSRKSDSALSEDPSSFNNERHEYCDVLPARKPSSYETTNDFADPSSAGNGNYCKIAGIENASKDEGKADARSNSQGAINESESLYAENGVLMKGQEYAMVDMEKKASQNKGKPEISHNTGNDLGKDDHGIDEVKCSPTKNKVIVNGQEYALVDMEKKASQRKEKSKITPNGGKGEQCINGESSSEKPQGLMNGQEYATVDMEKKALDRKAKSKMGPKNENYLETNDEKAYSTLEPDDSPENKDGQTNQMNLKTSSVKSSGKSSLIKKNLPETPLDKYKEVQPSGKETADIHKTPEGESDYDEPQPFGSSPAEQYDELQFSPNMSSDLSKKRDSQKKGRSSDDAAEDYQTVSAPTSPMSSTRPDSYPLNAYEAVSPPASPDVVLTGSGQYPSNDNKTGASPSSVSVEQAHRPLDTYESVEQDQTSGIRDSSASHTYEDPVTMAEALERPYDKLQRGPDSKKQLATHKTTSEADKGATERADHENALNVYDEVAAPTATLKEADESSGAYQHLQRPFSKRSKAREPLPAIPGDEGYGRLNLEDSASNQTNTAAHQEQESSDPATKEAGPAYATLENPAEAYRPDDDDPDYDLLDSFK